MQKLPGVGKFFNGWRGALVLPQKNEILDRKREYQTEKRKSHEQNIRKTLLNLRKGIFFRELWIANLSIANHHWHLHESNLPARSNVTAKDRKIFRKN